MPRILEQLGPLGALQVPSVACLASSVGQFRRPWPRYCVAAPHHGPL